MPEPKTSFKRITPLSADLAAHGRTRTLALQKLHRICLTEVRTSKPGIPWPPSSSPSPSIGSAIRAVGWPSPGSRPAEIFFSASFSLPREKLPYPALLFDGQLENLAKLPAPVSSLTSSLSWPTPSPGPRPTPILKELYFTQGRQHHHRP
jgi:hypothetical protein